MALTCGCGATEKVTEGYASRRRVFCGNCKQLLQRPEGATGTAPVASSARGGAQGRRPPSRAAGTGFGKAAAPEGPLPAHTQRMFDFERHVVAIAFWYRLGGVLAAVGAFILVALIGPIALIVLPLAAVPYLLGHGLSRYLPAARWLVVAISILSLARTAFAIHAGESSLLEAGLSIGWDAAVLAVLASASAGHVFSADYRDVVRRSAGVQVAWWTSPFFYLPAGLALLGLLAAASFVASALL
ncbi:MAG: hypothetical protein D6731_12075 [Planctomycetota bacterium]|nr:MAG: hypothetical protein D6731_12075 [Planctomycetota bacterium]